MTSGPAAHADMGSPVDPDQRVAPIGNRRAITAAVIGHAVEFYDYGLFATFSAILATVFFPTSDGLTGLMFTFAIYGVAYLARPVGAVVFGHLADRIGRKRALSTAILLMVVATVLIAVTPPHSAIGAWSALILCVARILQGISLGGELGGAMSYLVELAPSHRRGLYGSWQAFAGGCGNLGGAVVGAVMAAFMSTQSLESWGWRLAFLIAAPVGFVGLYIRLRLEESPAFQALQNSSSISRSPAVELLRSHRRGLATAIGLVVLFTVSTATWMVYVPGYLVKGVHLSANASLSVLAAGLAAYVVATPVIGHVSDRVGRRPVMLVGSFGLMALSYPGFMALGTGALALIVPTVAVIFVLMACVTTTVPTVLAEYFPARVRSSGVGICYALTVAVLGGTAPLVQVWLTSTTGNPNAPAFYVIVSAIVSVLLVIFVIRETSREQLET